MYINAVSLIFTVFTYILLCHHGLINIISVQGSFSRISAPHYIGDIAINCGCTGNSTGLDGREWIGEAASKLMSGKSRSSTAAESSFSGADPVPYMTSRISETPFHYTFQVKPGQKFIRLHFYPASYRGFEKSVDLFSVKAGPFTLLRDFSASRTSDQLGVKNFVKEFCVNVEENRKLNITFSPSLSRKSKTNTYAFVNGIEVISMPPSLYYSPDGDVGAPIVGQHNRFYSIDNSTALELIQRLNIGGSSIAPIEDFGMFRRWNEDTDYLLEPRVHRVSNPGDWIKFSNMPVFISPPKLYQTSWKTEGSARTNSIYKVTWKIPLNLGFGYLVRLHFCDFSAGMIESRKREFVVFINNHIAETKANVFKWSGGTDIPVYRDYVVIVKGDEEGRTSNLLISLESIDGLVSGLLNGLEIFKLSNPDNSLATSNPVFPEWVSTSWNQKIQNLFSAVGRQSINVISTVVTFIIIGVSTFVYKLRETREESIDGEKDRQSSSNESSCRIFSLAEIVLATQNFSDALFIGKGGFGKVYKGSVNGISEAVAIKRLNSNSRQGAQEFWTEIETLSNLRHVHLVSLIGYCNEYEEMILVYQNMSRGTLADNLYKAGRNGTNCVPLSWEQRLRICIGAARGLDYLHTGTECGVIHRDVKDTNILLDENLVAKISDFGLSKLEKLTQSRSYVSTKVKGTFGYLDPDYFMTQNLTRKTDVYAFGVVLLVALCGRPAVDNRNPEEPQSLLSCFRECVAEGGVDGIVDPSIQGKISPDSLEEFVKSVKNCLLHQPKKRPTMAQVVASLEHALEQHKNITPFVPNDASVVESFKFVLAPKIELQEEDIHDQVTEIHNEEHIIQSQAAQKHQESVISQQNKNALSSKHYQNSAFPISRLKPLWGWPWKESRSRGKALAMKKTELVSSSESDLVPTSGCGPRFSIEDIRAATDSFIDGFYITDGGYRKVCVGFIKHLEMTVSIYQFDFDIFDGEVIQLCREIERLARLRHRNLLSLIGYCYQEDQNKMFIVYDRTGSTTTLDKHLHSNRDYVPPLPWKCKLRICIGIAKGLHFLHKHMGQTTLHYDLRSANILLDETFAAKISIIGLYKVSHVGHLEKGSTKFKATGLEYNSSVVINIAPKSSEKSDVCSLGLLLLEILCCRRPVNFDLDHDNDERYLKHWVKNNIRAKRFHQIIHDYNSRREIAATCLAEFLNVALSCLLVCETERPSMDDVVRKLEHALELQERAEAAKLDFKGKGGDDGFNLEDIYNGISNFEVDR